MIYLFARETHKIGCPHIGTVIAILVCIAFIIAGISLAMSKGISRERRRGI